MSKEVDLIVCENNTEVFIAPAYCNLEKGDTIIVENSSNTMIVDKVLTVLDDYDFKTVDFIKAVSTRKTLRRVLSRIEKTDFEYNDEEEEFIKKINEGESENE